ncbi:MAG: energy-coupling factor ABC transporter permease [Gammaproteobacteria bacterium]|nr:energy-coupling factor ABC transporter permease [Gammaproteobacteria bacterium]MCP5423662.1 energy-coupling factor ABC transporter permease [Gammaproteobacteria bacterium]
MEIPAALAPGATPLVACLLWLIVLIVALRKMNWKALRGVSVNVFCGAVVGLLLLWRIDVSVAPGLGFHFLGVTVLTLMFGWQIAMIGISLVTLVVTFGLQGDLSVWPLNSLIFGILPIMVSYGVYRMVQRQLPHHIFIYIFLCAFFGSMLAASVSVFASVGFLVLSGAYPSTYINETYLPFLPLYLFPEGLLNGFLTTVFIGLRPTWLSTFDDTPLRG